MSQTIWDQLEPLRRTIGSPSPEAFGEMLAVDVDAARRDAERVLAAAQARVAARAVQIEQLVGDAHLTFLDVSYARRTQNDADATDALEALGEILDKLLVLTARVKP